MPILVGGTGLYLEGCSTVWPTPDIPARFAPRLAALARRLPPARQADPSDPEPAAQARRSAAHPRLRGWRRRKPVLVEAQTVAPRDWRFAVIHVEPRAKSCAPPSPADFAHAGRGALDEARPWPGLIHVAAMKAIGLRPLLALWRDADSRTGGAQAILDTQPMPSANPLVPHRFTRSLPDGARLLRLETPDPEARSLSWRPHDRRIDPATIDELLSGKRVWSSAMARKARPRR